MAEPDWMPSRARVSSRAWRSRFSLWRGFANGLNQCLDIIARGRVVTGFDLGLEVGGEVFGKGDGEGVHGGLGIMNAIYDDESWGGV